MGDPGDISQPYKHFVLLCVKLGMQYAAVIASIAEIGLVDRADGISPGVCAQCDCKAFFIKLFFVEYLQNPWTRQSLSESADHK